MTAGAHGRVARVLHGGESRSCAGRGRRRGRPPRVRRASASPSAPTSSRYGASPSIRERHGIVAAGVGRGLVDVGVAYWLHDAAPRSGSSSPSPLGVGAARSPACCGDPEAAHGVGVQTPPTSSSTRRATHGAGQRRSDEEPEPRSPSRRASRRACLRVCVPGRPSGCRGRGRGPRIDVRSVVACVDRPRRSRRRVRVLRWPRGSAAPAPAAPRRRSTTWRLGATCTSRSHSPDSGSSLGVRSVITAVGATAWMSTTSASRSIARSVMRFSAITCRMRRSAGSASPPASGAASRRGRPSGGPTSVSLNPMTAAPAAAQVGATTPCRRLPVEDRHGVSDGGIVRHAEQRLQPRRRRPWAATLLDIGVGTQVGRSTARCHRRRGGQHHDLRRGASVRSRGRASRPSIVGIDRSRSTTSGSVRRTGRRPSRRYPPRRPP